MPKTESKNSHPLSPSILLDWQSAAHLGTKIVGGKAWNLGRLQQFGFNVPAGGVLATRHYLQFIKENSLTELVRHASEHITLQNIDRAENEECITNIQHKIQQGVFPATIVSDLVSALKDKQLLSKPLAIRSSASAEDSLKASFAGIHDSFLNINGIDAIIAAIKSCYASLWSKRAISYRRKMQIHDQDVLPAVVIMQLIDADAAGVAFSCDPVSGREDICLVNANFGLGESVVNGRIESDSYRIHRYSFITEDKQCGKKQHATRLNKQAGTADITLEHGADPASQWVLNPIQQRELGLLISRIFSALSPSEVHQDIEWAIKDNSFYVLQARPVTVLPRYTADTLSEQPDIWSNSNFRDALPMVIPVVQRDTNVYTVNQTILASFNEFGLTLKPGLSIGKLFNGRLYFNTGLYQRLIYDAVGMMPEDFNLFSGGHQPNIVVPSHSPFSGLQGLARVIRMLKYARAISREQKQQGRLYAKINTYVADFKSNQLATLPDQDLLALLLSTEHTLLEFMDRYMLLSAGIGPFGIAIKSLKQAYGDAAVGVVSALAIGQGDLPSANQVYDLLELAEIARDDPTAKEFLDAGKFSNADWQQLPTDSTFRTAFAGYLEKYGYRAVFEVDLSQPRWHEDPSYLLSNIAKSMPTADLKRHKQRQQQLYNNAVENLSERIGFFKRKWVTKLVRDAVRGANTRETAKAYSVRLFGLMRFIYLEVGRRLHENNIINEAADIFDCSRADVLSILGRQWNGHGLKNLLVSRKKEVQELMRQDAADVIIDNEKIFQKAEPVNGDNNYQGIGVSAGQIKGIARRIHDPTQGARLNPGEIMIAPSTDPSWTPLFVNAAGIVLETGGYTSHGSIVAREYGIPAVVNVPGALKLINDGQVVFVNGETGSVVLE